MQVELKDLEAFCDKYISCKKRYMAIDEVAEYLTMLHMIYENYRNINSEILRQVSVVLADSIDCDKEIEEGFRTAGDQIKTNMREVGEIIGQYITLLAEKNK